MGKEGRRKQREKKIEKRKEAHRFAELGIILPGIVLPVTPYPLFSGIVLCSSRQVVEGGEVVVVESQDAIASGL